ncbi:MAG: hypothetical protein HQL44_17000 [Alphaproteobacteria bacterium]|nr:hypothetical protein [Alphaproteobacteria bacterium]
MTRQFMTPREFFEQAAKLRLVPRETRRDEMMRLMIRCLNSNGFGAGVDEICRAMGVDISDLGDAA